MPARLLRILSTRLQIRSTHQAIYGKNSTALFRANPMSIIKNIPFEPSRIVLCITIFLLLPSCQQSETGRVTDLPTNDALIPTVEQTVPPSESAVQPTLTATPILATSTPAPNPSDTPIPEEYKIPTLYLALNTFDYTGEGAEIWALGTASSELMYQRDPLPINDPLVPPEIQNRIKEYLQDPEGFNEITLTPVFSGLTSSTDKKYLAFIETFNWSRPDIVSEYFQHILILDVAQREIVAEAPVHAINAESLAWSPTGDYLLYTTTSRDNDYNWINQTWLYDQFLDQQTIIGDGSLATWSPDGSQIAFANSGRITIVSSADIENDDQVINFPKDTALQTLRWEIDDLMLGAAYVHANFTIGPQKLYLINPKTLLFSEYLPESPLPVLSSPRVSPNGELIALNARKNDSDLIEYLLAFNLKGELIRNFEIPQANWTMWAWTPDGQRILILLGFQPDTLQQDIGILDPLTGNFEIIQLPVEVRTKLEDYSHIIDWIGW